MARVAESLLAGKTAKSLLQVVFWGSWGFFGRGVCVFVKVAFENNIICCTHDEIPPSQLRQTADPWQYELSFSLCYMLPDPWMDLPLEKEHYLLNSGWLTHY